DSARGALETACGPATTSFKNLIGSITLTGVGFFDLLHGQSGVAPNGIELHPVLSVVSISCALAPPPTPIPPSPTPAPVTTPTPPAASGVTINFVTSPVARGAAASASAITSPNAHCSITYITPGGNTSTAAGLTPKNADGAGSVSWSWNISVNTAPGTGSV